jgi:PDDEXK-like domain of unknown function (DUF3799)
MNIESITECGYRSERRYSNSDLSEFKRLLKGDHRPLPKKAFHFGRVVHGMLLEPDSLTPEDWTKLTDEEQETSRRMYEAAQNNAFISEVIKIGAKEQSYYFEAAGLPCKAKLDIVVNDELIVDIKTTSSQNYIEFLDAISKFDYHRQAAFYLDATQKAKDFVFIGLQKHPPFEVFYVEISKWTGSDSIPYGRKEYLRLLNQIKCTNFNPSTWKPLKANII